MSRFTELVDLDVVLHHQTDKAWLISLNGDRNTAVWIPKSAGELEQGVLTITERLAIDKGLV